MEIYWIRHAQSVANLKKIYQGQLDSELSERGRKQAEALKTILPEKIDEVYSSPLRRAFETAKISLSDRDIEINVDQRLKEMDIGELEGIKKAEMTEHQKELWVKINTETDFSGHNGETGRDVIKRVADFFDTFTTRAINGDDKSILVFSHYGVIRSLFKSILNFEIDHVDNTDMLQIKFNDGSWKMKRD